MKTLHGTVNRVLSRLDDPLGETYSRALTERGIQLKYDEILRTTQSLWDYAIYDNIPQAGNVTAAWEAEFMAPGTAFYIYHGPINYTGHWELDYLGEPIDFNNAVGPRQCTAPWEAQQEYIPSEIPPELFELDHKTVALDRVTWDWRMLLSQFASTMRGFYARFKEHIQGDTEYFTVDSDGLLSLRVTPVPGTAGTRYTYDVPSDGHGIFRDDDGDELGDTDYQGAWGILRSTDGHTQTNGQWGHPVELHSDSHNTRVEYFRTGHDLSDGYNFEIPDRFVKFVEYGACSWLLAQEGPGQELNLSAYYKTRFEEGVNRLKERVNTVREERSGALGGNASHSGPPPLAQLPWQYGQNYKWNSPL